MTDNDKVADYLRQATLDLRAAKRRIRELESDPIAIVSMACRLPGGIDTPEQLWELLSRGGETLADFPDDRGWDLANLFHPDPDHPGTTYAHHAGFLDDAARFDADFFGISPREAAAMDPQQRLLLESCWELIENARIDPHTLRGSSTGVFLGVARFGYGEGVAENDAAEGYSVTGTAPAVASGRISYTMGFEGPSLSVDTACSSSLVALHLALESLRRGESSMAIVGGAAVMGVPDVFVDFSRQRGLAADGRSKAFGAEADGFGFAEGVGVILLERLSQAQRNGHDVLAVVRGSAINQDGASNGLASPSGTAQRQVIAQALESSRLRASDVDAVEAHGTGTALGDPIEANALLDTYGRQRDSEWPLWLGSVKSNIGHTQAAAGVVGVIKMVLALRNEALPETLHVDTPSPHVDWSSGTVALLRTTRPWVRGDRPRRAGVSAFGISGTNAHVLVEEGPEQDADESGGAAPAWAVPLILSARDPKALRAQAQQVAALVEAGRDLADLGFTLANCRARHEYRAAVVAGGPDVALGGLREIASGQAAIEGVAEAGASASDRRAIFVFPGQGAQWVGMGASLLRCAPVFREKIEACDEVIKASEGWTVSSVLRREAHAPDVERIDVVQPVLFAMMVSLAQLWRSYGVEPVAVVGHSQGEIAAAHVAGALSLTDAVRLVVHRSRALRALSGQGGMMALGLGPEEAEERIARWPDRLAVAAINGPRSVVVSGEPQALRELAQECDRESVRSRVIDVDYASHSPQVERIEAHLREETRGIRTRAADTPFYSTVDCAVVPSAELDADYWYRNLRQTVRFSDTIAELVNRDYDTFIEISPHPILLNGIEDTIEATGRGVDDAVVVGSLFRETDEWEAFATSMASAHVRGVAVRWQAAFPGAKSVPLPPYPFQRKRFWLSARRDPVARASDSDTVYEVHWSALTADVPATALPGEWLVVTASGHAPSWTDALSKEISALGGTPVLCEVDGGTSRARVAETLRRVVGENADFRGVLSLLAMDDSAADDRGGVPAGSVALLTLLQAMTDAGLDIPVWAFTRQAVRTSVDDRVADPGQAVTHGLGRVARVEMPSRWGCVLDLPESVDQQALRASLNAIAGTRDAEDVLAVRPEGIYGRRLVPASASRAGTEWSPRGAVLVTGAASPVGERLTIWLARHGARHLLLIGEPPGEALFHHLADSEVSAVVIEGTRDEIVDAVENAPEPVTALVHAETVTRFGHIVDLDPAEFADVVEAKTGVSGTLRDIVGNLEREVYCSSVAGVWGGAGMAAYAAGSAFLDAWAEHRRSAGHAALSLAWSPWQLPGVTVDDDYLRARGLRALPPEEALAVWERVVVAEPTSVVVAGGDWSTLSAGFGTTRPTALFDEVAGRETPANADSEPGSEGDQGLRDELSVLDSSGQSERLSTIISGVVADALGHESTADIPVRRPFSDLGVESLTAMRVRKRLAAITGLRLPASLVFDHPTIAVLAEHLRQRLVGDVDRSVPAATATSPDRCEPIAIVGIGCRFPGGIASPDELWQVLVEGGTTVGDWPTNRGWDLERLYHPDPDHPGTSYVDKGGFLDDAADFDPAFFGISPREALAMDPQQRLVLETTWEALERGGIDPAALRNSRTGVFIGMNGQSYMPLLAGESQRVDGYQGLGNSASVLSGRVAYTFGWNGPALTVDTACSSSLVGIHLAVESLRRGECTLALAGGVTVMSDPYTFVDFSRQRGLAKDGVCKPFSAHADGFALSEGVAVLALEPLSLARNNGHQVLALVRGKAVNQDGASNGLAAPNGPAQERVIHQALADAELAPHDVDVVEAHGTGTELGDPIEAEALFSTYGRDRDRALVLGSVKSNIGHAQAAAGAAGVIKIVLALRNGLLPRSLHADELSPHIDWSAGPVELAREDVPWPIGNRPRRAGVSSFGVSGTNAHLILEEAPTTTGEDRDASGPERSALPLVLSGRGERVVRDQARGLAEVLERRTEVPVVDIAHTLATGRARFDVRAAVLGRDRDELATALRALAEGQPSTDVIGPHATASPEPVMIFPGQGSQWAGMVRDLLDEPGVFADSMARCEAALSDHVDWTLRDVVRSQDTELFERVDVLQPVLFSIMVSLAELWRSCGVTPAAVVGHSQGEIAAAYLSGALSLEAAAKVVARRSRVLRTLDGHGGMVSVTASRADLDDILRSVSEGVSVAAINGPRSFVVAGATAALDDFVEAARSADMDPRRIAVGYASHSPGVEDIERHLAEELGTVDAHGGSVPLYSTLTGERIDTATMDAGYWYRNLREPVCFEQAVSVLLEAGFDTFIEVSPHPVLLMAVDETAQEQGCAIRAVPTLRRDKPGPHELTRNLLSAHAHGVDVDITTIVPSGQLVSLPTYPFEHQRFWPRPLRREADAAALGLGQVGHPLLSAVLDVPGQDVVVFTGRLDPAEHPWLGQHVINGRPLVPGSVLVDIALSVAEHVGLPVVDELVLHRPLVLAESGNPVRISVAPPDSTGRRSVELHAASGDVTDAVWELHATGVLAGDARPEAPVEPAPEDLRQLSLETHYDRLAESGYAYGPAFRAVRSAWRSGDRVLADVSIDVGEATGSTISTVDGYAIHPVLLDAVAQTLGLGGLGEQDRPRLPFSFNGVRLYATGATAVRVSAFPAGPNAMSLRVTDPAGGLVAVVDSLVIRDVVEPEAVNRDDDLKELSWTAVPDRFDRGHRVVTVDASSAEDALASLAASFAEGEPEPDAVVVRYCSPDDTAGPAVRDGIHRAASLVRQWLEKDFGDRTVLVFATSGAVGVSSIETVRDPGAAALWGVVRSAQAESPGRFVLVDLDGEQEVDAAALPLDHPQLALRGGTAFVPRLSPTGQCLDAAVGARLAPGDGSLDSVTFTPAEDAERALAPGEVRVDIRATGVNFRDVLLAFKLYPTAAEMGTEAAGVVLDVGDGVDGLASGDRVMGLFDGAFGPTAISDHRLLVPIPSGWRMAQAAAVPIAHTTAHYALHDLAGLRAGQSVLIHAAAGGVGAAAVAMARGVGAEVFATASPGKHEVLRAMGLDDEHIASSREPGFAEKFLAHNGGRGVDVVLNSLTGELLDESARMLTPGGVFVEMGKTDPRAPEEFAGRYAPFDLAEAGNDRLGEILQQVAEQADVHNGHNVTAWRLAQAPAVFRHMSRGRHVGKLVLTQPTPVDPVGTVLITGGTGTLGVRIARHFAAEWGVRNLLLVSRGGETDAVTRLREEVAHLPVTVEVVACDAADRAAMGAVVDAIPPDRPLTGVVHAAGVLADGLVTSIGPDEVAKVVKSKVDAAWVLHELTAVRDLSFFVLFSSAASALAGPGQGVYAAANGAIEALATHRHAQGLPAKALGWGLWEQASAMTEGVGERIARTGVLPLSSERALELFELALRRPEPVLYPLAIDRKRLSLAEFVPEVLRDAVRTPLRTAERETAHGESIVERLAASSEQDQLSALLDIVRSHAAAIAEHSVDVVTADQAFKDLGFDSLAAVELRNRLGNDTGVRLPSTLVFDHPTPGAVAKHLRAKLFAAKEGTGGDIATDRVTEQLDELEKAMRAAARQSHPGQQRDDLAARMESLLRWWNGMREPQAAPVDPATDDRSDEELFSLLDQRLGDQKEV